MSSTKYIVELSETNEKSNPAMDSEVELMPTTSTGDETDSGEHTNESHVPADVDEIESFTHLKEEESSRTEFIGEKRRTQSLTSAPVARAPTLTFLKTSPRTPTKKKRRRSILKKDSKFGDKRKSSIKDLSITFNETVVIHELKTWHYMDKLNKKDCDCCSLL